MQHALVNALRARGIDVLTALEENGNLGDLVLLPRVMLDNAGERFLDDITVEEFKDRLPVKAKFVRNAQETIDAICSIATPGIINKANTTRASAKGLVSEGRKFHED